MGNAAIYNPYWDALGGGERYAAALARLLLDHNWQVDIQWPQDVTGVVRERFGIDMAGVNFVSNLRPSRYDLLFWVSDGSVPISFAKKTIIHFQIPFHDRRSGSWGNKFKMRFYQAVCNSFFTKSYIDKTYAISSQVIYPPVAVDRFKPARKQKLIVSLARFSRLLHAKRQDVLIDAFAKLNLPGWRLVLAGGADDPDYFRQLLQKASGRNIELRQNITSDQVGELLAEAKIYWSATGFGVDPDLYPEKLEHFGVTPVEAMAAGAVPIVTALGGHLETVRNGQTGFLWHTLDELVYQTTKLAKDTRLWDKMSQRAQSHSRQFSTSVFNSKFLQLL